MEADCRVLVFFAAGDLRDADAVEEGLVGDAADAGAGLVFDAVRRDQCEESSE